MYCNECGAQIPDNSRFCSHCGHKQNEGEPSLNEKIANVIIENEITRQLVEAHKSAIDYQFLKKAMGWYLAWVVFHLGILLIFSDSFFGTGNYYMKNFVPFSEGSKIDEYDIREFFVYTIFPLAILIIWSMVRTQSNTILQDHNKHVKVIELSSERMYKWGEIEIQSNSFKNINRGQKVFYKSKIAPNGIYRVGFWKHIKVENGLIVKVSAL